MSKAFSVPVTPQGKSALATLPPWHYSSDCLAVEYGVDQNAIAALLPPGLTVDEKSAGRAFFWFLDWQFTGSNDELTDPARYQYREAFVLVEAVFDGVPVNYCPYIFVDNDAAIARGWAQGFPKKLGSVYQTRSFSAPSLAAAPLAKGSRFGASVTAHGKGWRPPVSSWSKPSPILRPFSTGRRPCAVTSHSSRPAAGTNHRSTNSPCRSRTVSRSWMWGGSAELKLPVVDGEDMHLIAPLRVGQGYRLGMAYSVTDLRILKNYAG
ncbi:MAG: acetoacetate decarboxylase family protein [Paraburkholderia sp.]|uniref:acetoacetate decarboxylase family protein n=1 Tax=Paraburkholderia sp. TaxID=1926495 RepID=UPI003C5843CA